MFTLRPITNPKMQQKLKLLESNEDLEKAQKLMEKNPENIQFYNSLKIELEKSFPYTKFKVYSHTAANNAVYFYGLKVNKITRNYILTTNVGNFVEEDFVNGFREFVAVEKLFQKEALLLIADIKFSNAAKKYVTEVFPCYEAKSYPCTMYYMDEEQTKKVLEMKIPDPPEGYYFDDVDPEKDAQIITETWRHSTKDEIHQTKEKLRRFPSGMIRHEKDGAVAFEMLDHWGMLNHQFVLPDHRRRGLGNLIELTICQKCLKQGIKVHKTVEEYNVEVLKRSDKSPIWTVLTSEGKPIIWDYLVFQVKTD
ncbi:unnamed protein product [Caenorhabditis auriculariae]|uniref:Glycine N-acyltransferase-like protein n=1 Tax=Caenorhabditis auriculariae TaxID=2777116 RepID=A0A8S1HUF6_9PELO|nr:unnamed protein product [Caenorhabditis auriculariae]